MKFTVVMPGLTDYAARDCLWDIDMAEADFRRFATAVESFGYAAATVSEHIVIPNDILPQFGAKWPQSLVAQAFFLGATSTLRIVNNIMVLPYYTPLNLAKAISTLDLLSGGRTILAVGIGHARREFEALGIPFETRGARSDEYLQAIKILWTQDAPSFHGRFVSFEDIVFEPKSVQKPHPPIWIGGNSEPALRRAVRYGDFWNPARVQPDDLPRFLDYMHGLPEWAERDRPLGFHIPIDKPNTGTDHKMIHPPGQNKWTVQEMVDAVGGLQEMGVTWTQLPTQPDNCLDERLDQLQRMAEEVLPHFS